MKKHFLTTATFVASILLTGQAFAQKGFSLGFRYMVTKSALLNSSDKDAGPQLQRESTTSFLSGGVAFGYGFTSKIGLELDVLYVRQGQEYSGVNAQTGSAASYAHVVAQHAMFNNQVSAGEYQAKAELNVIKIPVLIKFNTDNRKPVFYTLSVGPQANITKSAVFELNSKDVELPGTNIVPDDVYRKVTLDGVLAVGAGINLSSSVVLSAQARFDYGFQDVEKKGVTYTYNNTTQSYYGNGRGSTHNGSAALMVGLSLDYKPIQNIVFIYFSRWPCYRLKCLL